MNSNSFRSRQLRRLSLQRSEEDEVIVNINTTPLIDVMLVLLVMLIITIPLQTQSVQLSLGRSEPTNVSKQPPSITVAIDFDNSLSVDNDALPNEDALQEYFRTIAAMPEQPVIFIKPNRLSDYKTVATVLADAQRLGVKKIGIIAQD